MSSCIAQHLYRDLIKLEPTDIEKHFINLVENGGIMRKQVSLMYNKPLTDTSDDTNHIKQQWELELNVTLDYRVWGNVCSGCH